MSVKREYHNRQYQQAVLLGLLYGRSPQQRFTSQDESLDILIWSVDLPLKTEDSYGTVLMFWDRSIDKVYLSLNPSPESYVEFLIDGSQTYYNLADFNSVLNFESHILDMYLQGVHYYSILDEGQIFNRGFNLDDALTIVRKKVSFDMVDRIKETFFGRDRFDYLSWCQHNSYSDNTDHPSIIINFYWRHALNESIKDKNLKMTYEVIDANQGLSYFLDEFATYSHYGHQLNLATQSKIDYVQFLKQSGYLSDTSYDTAKELKKLATISTLSDLVLAVFKSGGRVEIQNDKADLTYMRNGQIQTINWEGNSISNPPILGYYTDYRTEFLPDIVSYNNEKQHIDQLLTHCSEAIYLDLSSLSANDIALKNIIQLNLSRSLISNHYTSTNLYISGENKALTIGYQTTSGTLIKYYENPEFEQCQVSVELPMSRCLEGRNAFTQSTERMQTTLKPLMHSGCIRILENTIYSVESPVQFPEKIHSSHLEMG